MKRDSNRVDMKSSIVIAESLETTRSALKLLMENRLDIQITAEVGDMQTLLQILPTVQPTLLIVDWQLPGLCKGCGIETLRAQCSHMKIVVMSVQPEAHALAISAGADAFFTKTEPAERILEFVQNLLPSYEAKNATWENTDPD